MKDKSLGGNKRAGRRPQVALGPLLQVIIGLSASYEHIHIPALTTFVKVRQALVRRFAYLMSYSEAKGSFFWVGKCAIANSHLGSSCSPG